MPNKFPHLTSPLLENLLIPKKFVSKYEFTAKFEGKNFNRPEMDDIKEDLEGKEIVKLDFNSGEKILIKTLISYIKDFNVISIQIPIYKLKNSEFKELISSIKPAVKDLSIFVENGS